MRLSEVPKEGRELPIPRLDRSEIRLLWAIDYYDAPINGFLRYRGKIYYFLMHEAQKWLDNEELPEGQHWPPPIYLVIEVTDEQLAEEARWHELVLDMIGNGSEYADDQLSIGVHHPDLLIATGTEESIHKYWEIYRNEHKPLDLFDNEVIGWFIR
jgi:hypothetical protein